VDGETGLLVPPADVPALAAAIRSLAADPQARARMGAAGRARVVAEFGEAAVAEQTLALIGRALAGHAGQGEEGC
jgi:glycosyltransferase involved in cell wall biosynthesis